MGILFVITSIGIVSGIVGTCTGGLMAFFIKDISNRNLGCILEFSSGLMTAVVCFKLVPEAFYYGGSYLALAGLILGVIIIMICEELINKSKVLNVKGGKKDLLRTGILMAIGLALHNFPEGIAVGAGFEASTKLGIALAFVIAVHDIPEGIAMAVPMRVGGYSKIRSFGWTFVSAIPMGIGALIGALVGEISKSFVGICMGFAGGAMLYLIAGQLIPESKNLYRGRFTIVGNILGIIIGIIVCNVV